MKLGINTDEIICGAVKYQDLTEPFIFKKPHPYELFIKEMQFSDQKEGRIVINTSNNLLKSFLKNETITIGSLFNIACIHESYTPNQLNIFINLKAPKE